MVFSLMLSITNSVLLMTALFNAGLAIIVLRGNLRDVTNSLLGIYLAVLSLWSLALIGTQIGDSYSFWIYCAKGTYAAGLIIAASFYLFSISFPETEIPSKKSFALAYGSVLFFILALYAYPPFLVEKIISHSWGNGAVLNVPQYILFTALFCVLYIGGLIRIWWKYFKAQGEVRARLLVIGLGVTITGVAGLYFDIILASPFIDQFQYIWTGPLFNTAMAVLIIYAVFRLHLFNAKVIITELLIALLWIFTFLRTLLAAQQQEQVLNGGLFLLSLAIGSLLIRSVRSEVEQRERIEKLSQEKSEFMTFASHEIRNPITAMRGYASLILDGTTGEIGPKTKEVAQTILVQGNDVLNLIAQYLSKSKMELGLITYAKAPFDLGHAAISIAEGYKPHAEQKGLTLQVKIDPAQKYVVIGDEGKVKEVVGNIVDNSLKYTKTGGITISVERHGVSIRTVVSDTGVGIPTDTLPHLFKKFSRADAQKVNLLGTGIGLYLAKTFIEAQGGHIWAESDGKDKGSRFIIEFPSTESSSSKA
jgi:signal transduction histidine kinase